MLFRSDCISIGVKKIVIKGIGKYSGKLTCTYTIKPKTATITALKSKNKAVTVTWKRDKKVTGYELFMASSKNGTYQKVAVCKKNTVVSFKETALKKGKTYYFKVRSYKTVNGSNIRGNCSKVRSVKVK